MNWIYNTRYILHWMLSKKNWRKQECTKTMNFILGNYIQRKLTKCKWTGNFYRTMRVDIYSILGNSPTLEHTYSPPDRRLELRYLTDRYARGRKVPNLNQCVHNCPSFTSKRPKISNNSSILWKWTGLGCISECQAFRKSRKKLWCLEHHIFPGIVGVSRFFFDMEI